MTSRPGGGFGARTLPNMIAVAQREFVSRARTRTFKVTTVILVLGGIALALAPVLFRLVEGETTGDRVEVVVGEAQPSVDVVLALGQILNATPAQPVPVPGEDETAPRFIVSAAPEVAAARQNVIDGKTVAALALGRTTDGTDDLTFELYSRDSPISRRVQLIRQAAISITIQDRLTRAGLSPIDQARLFTPPEFELIPADPDAASRPGSLDDPALFYTGFALTIAIFMAIILYGQWIAYSVAEEKNSRVMEIVLAAATPFQLLAGKVIGVGALAIFQYVVVAIPMIAALALQAQVAALLLGGQSTGVDLASGLSIPLIATFGVMLILGFAVYASLYAGAASLVSRQEDINQIVAPLTIVSVIGYLVSTYAGTGLLPIDSPLVVTLSFIPLFSPYLMLTRLTMGVAGPLDVLVAVALLLITIPAALWLAARLYRSGVLMYGQSPTPRTFWRALRAR